MFEKPWRVLLVLVCAGVVGFYGWKARTAVSEFGNAGSAGAYYNLLADGFSHGQLNLTIPAPAGLQALADPLDPAANARFRGGMFAENRLHDTSYYHGKLYLYFSPVPALLVFLPYHALTGAYLSHSAVVAIFCAIGFLTAVWLIHRLWQNYFPAVHESAVIGGALALGFANGVPPMMFRPDLWEVPIACAYAFTSLALVALWQGLHDPKRRNLWALATSVACALAIASRPSAVFVALILLVPLHDAWRGPPADGPSRRRRVLAMLFSLAVPLLVVGGSIALYNFQRFDNPLEFGQRYQLAGDRQDSAQHFSGRYLWFNFRLYFLSLANFDGTFPYVHEVTVPPLPRGHGIVDRPYGVLANTPILLFAAVLPLVWHSGTGRPDPLRRFVAAVLIAFCTSATILCLFYGTCTRYLVEFAPALALLACIGWFASLDPARDATDQPIVAGCSAVFLACTVGFGILTSFQAEPEHAFMRGSALVNAGRVAEGIALHEKAVAAKPQWAAAQFALAEAYNLLGRTPESVHHYEIALQLDPLDPAGHNDLGNLYLQTNRVPDAVTQYGIAAQLSPENAFIQINFGSALVIGHRSAEALAPLQRAVRTDPTNYAGHQLLSAVLKDLGRDAEARQQYAEARRLNPALPNLVF